MFLAQFLHNFCTTLTSFFFKSTIEYLEPTCKKTNLMIDKKKKKVVRIVQTLCKSCARNITHKLGSPTTYLVKWIP
jgi:transposase-like protein